MQKTGGLLVVMLLATNARAELGPIPGEERFTAMMPVQNSAGASVGYAGIGEDKFVQLTLKTELNLGDIGFGLQVPLNLRVLDEDPKNDDDYYGYIREEDWDQPTEFLKVIRYVRLGHKRDTFFLRVGELAAGIGHGTIMYGYINNIDVNTFRLGTQLDINTNYGGIETVVNDVATTFGSAVEGSRILGVRGYFKPVALWDPESIFNIVQVGTSLVTDLNAPKTYKTVDGQVVIEDEQLVPKTTTAATVYGFDLEAEVMHNVFLDLVPYTDLNFIQQAGWGWHAGILATLKLPIGFELQVPARLEYRRFKSNYLPQYFGTFYEVERYNFAIRNDAANDAGVVIPKATVQDAPGDEGINGFYGELAFNFANILMIGASYEEYEHVDPNLQAFLSVPALDWLQFKAFYARTGITGQDDIFQLDERSLAVAQIRYAMFAYVYLVGRVTQRWVLETDQDDSDYGEYVPKREWAAGLETSFTF
jgi:hypothetical protein